MKIKNLKKKAYYKIGIGIMLFVFSGFLALLSCLKSIYFISKQDKFLGEFLSDLVCTFLNFLFSKTNFVPLLWTFVWKKLPIFNPTQIMQKENYYFLFLFVMVFSTILLIQDGFGLIKNIKKIEIEVEKERLKQEIKKQKGLIETSKSCVEIEINVLSRDSWYKRPLGVVILGLITVILARVLIQILHLD